MTAYLKHKISRDELADWAARAMMEEDFDPRDVDTLSDIVARIGLADVQNFDLTWEDCESFLSRLGYRVELQVSPAL
jgi:hypothetical protein